MKKVSKTKKKRQALSVQDLGEKLVALSDEQIGQMGLREDILSAIALAKRIKKHGGRKRQIQYLGVLMRRIDTAPIEEAVHNLEEESQWQIELHKQAERWRDGLVQGNDSLPDEFLMKVPEEDREKLRTLIANARQELIKKRPSPAPSRALFRFLYRSAQRS
jgi:ribosome-associated protein